MDWLTFYHIKFIINDTAILIDTINNQLSSNKFHDNKIVIWFNGFNTEEIIDKQSVATTNLISDFYSLFKTFRNFKVNQNIFELGNMEYYDNTTKISILNLAQKLGLNIPTSKIVTSKKELINFKRKYNNIITKSLNDNSVIQLNEYQSMGYRCNCVTEDIIKKMGDTFAPSLLQQEIKKEFEIRTFFLNGAFSSMAIFSQSDAKTATDFRNFNSSRSNRCVPFTLPKSIEIKLLKLLERLRLNIASIDMIYTPTQEYIFLEINQFGQWGFVATNCNYNIEKQIPVFLKSVYD